MCEIRRAWVWCTGESLWIVGVYPSNVCMQVTVQLLARQHPHLISAMLFPVATAAFPTVVVVVVVVVVTYLGVVPSASLLHAPFFFSSCSICYSTKGEL